MTSYLNTGCHILDSHGVTLGTTSRESRDICLHCEEDECFLGRNIKWQTDEEEEPEGREIDVQCQGCGCLETLVLVDGMLGTHPRFTETLHLRPDGTKCGEAKRLG